MSFVYGMAQFCEGATLHCDVFGGEKVCSRGRFLTNHTINASVQYTWGSCCLSRCVCIQIS